MDWTDMTRGEKWAGEEVLDLPRWRKNHGYGYAGMVTEFLGMNVHDLHEWEGFVFAEVIVNTVFVFTRRMLFQSSSRLSSLNHSIHKRVIFMKQPLTFFLDILAPDKPVVYAKMGMGTPYCENESAPIQLHSLTILLTVGGSLNLRFLFRPLIALSSDSSSSKLHTSKFCASRPWLFDLGMTATPR